MKIFAFTLILLVQGCTNTKDITCPSTINLTTIESEKINQIIINNEFISGCVTEIISDFTESSVTKYLNQCKADFANTLNYVQWLEIYNSCMIK